MPKHKSPERRKAQWVAEGDTTARPKEGESPTEIHRIAEVYRKENPNSPTKKIFRRYDSKTQITTYSLDIRETPHKYPVKKRPKPRFLE